MNKAQILALVGSGEFKPSMEVIDSQLLQMASGNKVSILPTAAGLEHTPDQWIKNGIAHFKKLSAKPEGLKVLNKKDANNKDFSNQIKNTSLIYFSGGHPGHLLNTLKSSLLWKTVLSLYKSGEVLAGSSAGAMVMGSHVLANAQEIFDQAAKKVSWKKGLNLIPYSIIPHYDAAIREQPETLNYVLQNTPANIKNLVIGIDENTAVIITNSTNAIVMGLGNVYVFKNGSKKIYKTGKSFKI